METEIRIISFIIGYIFYLVIRYFLIKTKNYELPILFERYYDDPKKTWLQPAIFIPGFIIPYLLINHFLK